MGLLMGKDEVLELLVKTGALRKGHFVLPNGQHTETYVQLELALRYYRNARILAVGLSRLLRSVPAVRPYLPKVAIVTGSNTGIPVAFGVREALEADQIFWAESSGGELQFPQFIEVQPGEKFIIVNDAIRHGGLTTNLCQLVTEQGGEILAVGTIVDLRVARAKIEGHQVQSMVHLPVPSYDTANCPRYLLEKEAVRVLHRDGGLK